MGDVAWQKGSADVKFREIVHDLTESFAHTGQRSEHLRIDCETGSHAYYFYPTGKAPVNDELHISVWLRSNRPGFQILARVVLPKERNPNNLDEPLTTLLRGDLYLDHNHFRRLEIRAPAKLARQQQQLMRAELKRDIDFTDAYVDQVLVNAYAGPGLTELWIDDLEIGPVLDSGPFRTTSRPAGPVKLSPPGSMTRSAHSAIVEQDHDQLLVNGKRFFFHGVRYTDTPLAALSVLRDASLNTIWFDHSTPNTLLDEAASLGLWIVPMLPVAESEARFTSSSALQQEVTRFLERDRILFWDLGGELTEEQAPVVQQAARLVRANDPQRPIGADAWDGFRPYSRNLDLLGAHRWPLLTGLELPQYREWLNQRRLLARSGVFLWTWIQTHLPDWYTALIYDRAASSAFDEPIGPQPEQIRLLTYSALAAGCRGLGYWSDRFLADSHHGRDRLLALGLLNLELRMLEPLLVTAEEPNESTWISTSIPEVKAAVLRTAGGVLVLPMWLGKGAQFVPGQSASAKLTIDVPQVPPSTQIWEISPGEIRCLQGERVPGGTRVKLPEFGVTAAILFTSDFGLIARFQERCSQTSKQAAEWAAQLAEEEIKKAAHVHEQLQKAGHQLPDADKLLADARRRLQVSLENQKSGNSREAYAEADRAVRPVRIMMRAYWEEATKELDSPVASPYGVSYYTLPRQWNLMSLVHQATPGANFLPDGDFEVKPDRVPQAWLPQETTLDDVELSARRVSDSPHEGQQCLMLQIKPKNPQTPPEALERTFLAINSPAVRLQPGALVRISGWVRIPKSITASVDGALFYDSAGGEPLAVRLTAATPWKKFTLYRLVPASGTINVTLALTGLGSVYFDDVQIEPLLRKLTPQSN
jgi:hypothetical protein